MRRGRRSKYKAETSSVDGGNSCVCSALTGEIRYGGAKGWDGASLEIRYPAFFWDELQRKAKYKRHSREFETIRHFILHGTNIF